jgi:hypothetical protein
MFTTVKKTLVITAALMTWALSPSAAQDTASILRSLPAALSGAPAVMVDNLKLCGGECYKGANCHTGGYEMTIYVRSGRTWKKAHEDGVRSAVHILEPGLEQRSSSLRGHDCWYSG